MSKKAPKIVIIGGGQAANMLLEELAEIKKKRLRVTPLDIEILEASDQLMSGLAWNEKNLRPFHLANTYYDRFNHINVDELSAAPDPAGDHILKNEVSRLHVGRAKRMAIFRTLDQLTEHNSNVVVNLKSAAVRIDKKGHGYTITTADGATHEADYCILAPGHTQHIGGLHKSAGVFASPWPASRLEQEATLNDANAIMGTGLSGIDAALTLAHAAGTFQRVEGSKKRDLVFRPKPGCEKFSITMFSPHGFLPFVLGEEDNFVTPNQNINSSGLDALFQDLRKHFIRHINHYEPPSFSRIRSMRGAINYLYTSVRSRKLHKDTECEALLDVLSDDSLTLDEALEKFHRHIASRSLEEHVTEQCDRTAHGLAKEYPHQAQVYLRKMVSLIESHYRDFSAEDQERFMHDVRPVLTKIAYGMVYSNAKQIEALIKGGFLKVQALGQDHSINTDGEHRRRGAEIRYRDENGKDVHEYFPSVVMAYGDVPAACVMRHL